MRSRPVLACVALTAAAAASVATDYDPGMPSVSVVGPTVQITAGEPQMLVLDVAYTGDGALAASRLEFLCEPVAGRWLGNPELAVTVTDETTGEEVASGSDRQFFLVSWNPQCEDAATCTRTYRIDLELAHGREAEVTTSAALYYPGPWPDDTDDTDDTDPEPITATLVITGP